MRYLLLVIVLSISLTKTTAQGKMVAKFNSYNSIGFVAGKSPVAFTTQSVNGFSYKHWFVGAGVGLDNYFMITLPLFASIRKDFVFKKNALFLYGDVGSHIVLNGRNEKNNLYSFSTKGKFYLDAGVGYKFKINKTGSIFFSAGNTLKNITETESYTDMNYPSKNEIKYKLARISIRMGYQF